MKRSKWIYGLGAMAAVSLAGCGGGDSGVGDDGFSDTYGFLSLSISDGPIHDAEKVCITFTDIELKPMNGASTTLTLSSPEKINLLDFQGTNAMPILTSERLPAGQYEWMRLGVDAVRGANGGLGDTNDPNVCDGEASYIVMNDGAAHNVYVPSGENNGLKLHGGYTVPANDRVSLTAEFDLGKSMTAPPGQAPDVMLRPTIKLVNNNEVGTLTGQVANELAEAESCQPSVYVFEDGVVDADDPVATAMVESQDQADGSVEWHYTIGFLLAGDYEAAFTCDGETLEPAEGSAAAIVAGEVTTVDFSALAP